MQNGNGKPRKPNQERNSGFSPIGNREPLDADEFKQFEPHPDFWSVHAERFAKGLTKEPIITEHPKSTVNLSKLMRDSKHYFVVEDPKRRMVSCSICPMKHGGILEAHLLTQYKIENGVLSFQGKAINETP